MDSDSGRSLAVPLQTDGGPFPIPWPRSGPLAEGAPLVDAAWFVTVALGTYLLGRLTVYPLVVRAVRARNPRNPTVLSAVETYGAVALATLALVAGLLFAGYGWIFSDTALLLAALTFTVGTAAGDVVGSLVSGLFLVSDPDFNVGDWIRWPDGEGIVEDISFRVTRVRTADNETVTVPNTELTGNAIVRPFGRGRVRATETVHLTYDDDLDRAAALLAEAARVDERTLERPDPVVRVDELGEGHVTLRLEYHVDEPTGERLARTHARIRERTLDNLLAAGIDLGGPVTQELSGEVAVSDADRGSSSARERDGGGSD